MFQAACTENVPEIMKSDFFALGPFQNGFQPFSNGGGISGGIFADRRGKHPAGAHAFPVLRQNVYHWRWEDNAAAGCLGFGLGDHQFALDPMDLSLHTEGTRLEIEVIPLQSADLATAQTCGELQQEEFVTAVLLGLD